jgi:hypothetical protein
LIAFAISLAAAIITPLLADAITPLITDIFITGWLCLLAIDIDIIDTFSILI